MEGRLARTQPDAAYYISNLCKVLVRVVFIHMLGFLKGCGVWSRSRSIAAKLQENTR